MSSSPTPTVDSARFNNDMFPEVIKHPEPGLRPSNEMAPVSVPDSVDSLIVDTIHTAVFGTNPDGTHLAGVPLTLDGVHPSSDGSRR